jgi:molybdopterin molybdotransferase
MKTISFDSAHNKLINGGYRLNSTERVSIHDSLNRILAEDITSDTDMPPFDKSLMDGYAINFTDVALNLEVTETIPAGVVPVKDITKGTCAKIMTGAMIPHGADTVIKVENTETRKDETIKILKTEDSKHISYKGSQIKEGQSLLKKGTRILPHHMTTLALAGVTTPLVSRNVKVGVIATGDEIVEPDKKPKPSQIRNTNSAQLIAQINQMGCISTYYGIAKDNKESTNSLIQKAMEENDVILLSGGVSMGDFDFVPKCLKENNFDLVFEKISVKPGKPTVFGTNGNKYAFGLPGNPVSTFVIFDTLVKPFLYKLMNHDYTPTLIRATVGKKLTAKREDRTYFAPVQVTSSGMVLPISYLDSSHGNAISKADGFVTFEPNQTEIDSESSVSVRLINKG